MIASRSAEAKKEGPGAVHPALRRSSARDRLEVVANAEAHHARVENADDPLERRARHGGEVRHRARVERVEDVDHCGELANLAEAEALVGAEVEDADRGRTVRGDLFDAH